MEFRLNIAKFTRIYTKFFYITLNLTPVPRLIVCAPKSWVQQTKNPNPNEKITVITKHILVKIIFFSLLFVSYT
jgi:hypothetical protein